MAQAHPGPTPAQGVRMGTPAGRRVLLATVLGSGMAFLDGTVVNIALPRIGEDLGADLAALQWTVNAYALTLAGLLLLGGALGDRLGRRRVFVAGVAWFTAASVLCALAPTVETLIAARALQGAGAALLVPGSLAIIEGGFAREDRGAAIGAWSGLAGVATALGPFLGGYLIDAASWRLIFLINVPLGAVVAWVAVRHVPETRDPEAAGHPLDIRGAVLAAVGLAGVTHALIEGGASGWTAAPVVVTGVAGTAACVAFVVAEGRTRRPLVPMGLFRSRAFTGSNAVTVAVYGAVGAVVFLVPIQLQQVLGYSALQAGAALFPMTVMLLLLSSRAGRLAQRIGPRIPLTAGPLVAAVGIAALATVDADAAYATGVLPGVLLFALGMAITVAPLTATVMAAAGERMAGVASAVNNTVARVAGLVAVAVVPAVAGIAGDDYRDPALFSDGYRVGLLVSAGLCLAGAVLGALLVPGRDPRAAGEPEEERHCSHCALDAPPLRDEAGSAAVGGGPRE